MFRNFVLPTRCICEYILYHLYKKFPAIACSVHQFRYSNASSRAEPAWLFQNRRALDKKILQRSFSLRGVNYTLRRECTAREFVLWVSSMPAASLSVSTSVDIKVYTENSSITHVHIRVTLSICIKKISVINNRVMYKPQRNATRF